MPRVDNDGPEVEAWCERTREGSSTYDVCTDCYHEWEGEPIEDAGLCTQNGNDEPYGVLGGDIGYGAWPEDLEDMQCEICKKQLTPENYGYIKTKDGLVYQGC